MQSAHSYMPMCFPRRVSSADSKRQELDEEKASLAKMRPHKRKMYKLEKQLVREQPLCLLQVCYCDAYQIKFKLYVGDMVHKQCYMHSGAQLYVALRLCYTL